MISSSRQIRWEQRQLLTSKNSKSAGPLIVPVSHRKRQLQTPCDVAFLNCLPNDDCLNCFEQLGAKDINWASVSSATPCSEVLTLLTGGGHCVGLPQSGKGKDLFCDTFNSCIVWNDDDSSGGNNPDPNKENDVDCDKLTKCEWEEMHRNFLADGICQRFGCYNSKVCNYDGGDCCKDTCRPSSFAEVSRIV